MARSEVPAVPLALVAFAGLLSLAVAMGIGRFAFTPVLPLALGEGLLDVAQAGWIAAANYLGYLVGALSAARLPLRPSALAVMGLLGTAALTAAMGWSAGALWLPLRFLAGVASAWVFVATSVWCLGTLASRGGAAASGWVYAGVGIGIALAGALCLVAAAAGVRSASLWLQLGGLALLLAGPVVWVIARLSSGAASPASTPARASHAETAGSAGLVACYGVMGFGYILPATFLPVLARSVVDDPLVFGLAWPVFGATAALSAWLGARALRDATRLRTWAACQLAMGLGVLLPALWANIWTITLSAVLVGGTFMVITLAGVQEMRARAPAGASRGVGRITAAFALGQMAGPAVSSLLLHTTTNSLALALGSGALALLGTGAWLLAAASRMTIAQEVLHG